MEQLLLLSLFIVGIMFRLWLISLVPQPFVFDQVVYDFITSSIQTHVIYVDRFRTYGYPLIMAFVGLIGKTPIIWKMFQAGLDTAVAILVYLIGKKIFGDKRPAILSGLLYLFNPYTSAYTGVFLTETTTIFLMTLVFFLFAIFLRKRRLIFVSLLSFTLGYLVQVRSEFFYFSVFSLFLTLWVYWKTPLPGVKKIAVTVLAILIFLSAFIYQIIGNLSYFGEFSLLTVDNAFVKELYISTQIKRRLTGETTRLDQYPSSVEEIFREYSLPDTPSGRKQMAKKYWDLTMREIRQNPNQFILSRIEKFWYVWEKHILYYYTQPKNRVVDFLTLWGNNLLLLLFMGGLFIRIKGQSSAKNILIAGLTVFTVFYISAVHSISLTEERFSLPAYPLLFLFAAVSVERILYNIYNKIRGILKLLNK